MSDHTTPAFTGDHGEGEPTPVLPARRHLLVGGAAALAAFGLSPAAHAASSASATGMPALAGGRSAPVPRSRLHRWAADTWHSLDAMTDPDTGLPADNIPASLAPGDRSGYTSPTNIGGDPWSAVRAGGVGVISPPRAPAP